VSFTASALAVARKDLLIEWRSREVLPALAQFVLLALVVTLFAFDVDAASASRIAPGVLWLVVLFAGLVAFGRAFAAEKEQASLEALLMTPAGPVAVFAGKALAAALVLVGVDQRHLDVVQRRRPRDQVEGLEDEADLAVAHRRQDVALKLFNRQAVQQILAVGGSIEAADQVH